MSAVGTDGGSCEATITVVLLLHGPCQPRRRRTTRQAPSSWTRTHGSFPPPGVPCQLKGVLLLLVLSLLPDSGDVQKDIRVAPVLRRRSRYDVPPVLFGVPNSQNGPPVELPVGPPFARPLPGPCSQFLNRRMAHPVDRDRLGLFAFQKDAVADDASDRAIATLASKRSSAEILVRIQLRRRRLGRARPRVHHVNGRFANGNAVQDGENPAPGVETPTGAGARWRS